MYKILNAEKLSANVFLMDVEAPAWLSIVCLVSSSS